MSTNWAYEVIEGSGVRPIGHVLETRGSHFVKVRRQTNGRNWVRMHTPKAAQHLGDWLARLAAAHPEHEVVGGDSGTMPRSLVTDRPMLFADLAREVVYRLWRDADGLVRSRLVPTEGSDAFDAEDAPWTLGMRAVPPSAPRLVPLGTTLPIEGDDGGAYVLVADAVWKRVVLSPKLALAAAWLQATAARYPLMNAVSDLAQSLPSPARSREGGHFFCTAQRTVYRCVRLPDGAYDWAVCYAHEIAPAEAHVPPPEDLPVEEDEPAADAPLDARAIQAQLRDITNWPDGRPAGVAPPPPADPEELDVLPLGTVREADGEGRKILHVKVATFPALYQWEYHDDAPAIRARAEFLYKTACALGPAVVLGSDLQLAFHRDAKVLATPGVYFVDTQARAVYCQQAHTARGAAWGWKNVTDEVLDEGHGAYNAAVLARFPVGFVMPAQDGHVRIKVRSGGPTARAWITVPEDDRETIGRAHWIRGAAVLWEDAPLRCDLEPSEALFTHEQAVGTVYLNSRDQTIRQLRAGLDAGPVWVLLSDSNDAPATATPEESPMTTTPDPSLLKKIATGLQPDVDDAAWRTAGKQFVRLARDPLVAALSRHLAPGDDALRARLAELLRTEFGEALLTAVLAAGLSALPARAGAVPQRLARELRVRAMAEGSDLLAEVLMAPLRQLLAEGILGEALGQLDLPGEGTGVRVGAGDDAAAATDDPDTTRRIAPEARHAPAATR